MSLTSVGKLYNKVVRIPNGGGGTWNISVSYSCQFKIMHFIVLHGQPFGVVFSLV